MDVRIETGGRRGCSGAMPTAVAALVRDAVEDGASIGFVLPLADEVLAGYVGADRRARSTTGARIVLLALDGRRGGRDGAARRSSSWPNGRHRADAAEADRAHARSPAAASAAR